MNELIIAGIGLLSTIITGWTSWFFARKKYNTEVDKNYLDNLQEALKTYDSIIAHNKSEIEHLMRKNDALEAEVADLRRQVQELTMNVCNDLTYMNRVREIRERKLTKNGKNKDRLDETKSPSAG